jgi:hypothetical protein
MPRRRIVDGNVDHGDLLPKRPSGRGQGWLSRPVKALLIFLAVVAGFFEHSTTGWGAPISIAAAALVVSVLYYRNLWDHIWFWITVVLLAAFQVPLIIAMRPIIKQARMFYMGVFLMADALFIITVITLMSQIEWKD